MKYFFMFFVIQFSTSIKAFFSAQSTHDESQNSELDIEAPNLNETYTTNKTRTDFTTGDQDYGVSTFVTVPQNSTDLEQYYSTNIQLSRKIIKQCSSDAKNSEKRKEFRELSNSEKSKDDDDLVTVSSTTTVSTASEFDTCPSPRIDPDSIESSFV